MFVVAICLAILATPPVVRKTGKPEVHEVDGSHLLRLFNNEKEIKQVLAKLEHPGLDTRFLSRTVNNRRVICVEVSGGYNMISSKIYGYHADGKTILPFCFYSAEPIFGGPYVSISDKLEIEVKVRAEEFTGKRDASGYPVTKSHMVPIFIAKPPPLMTSFHTGQKKEDIWIPRQIKDQPKQ